MVLKLYGLPVSTCTQRVIVTLKEYNVTYELIPVDITKGAHKDPKYMEIQPFGQIPYIDDEGYILYESRAICRYIAAKHASQGPQPSLMPLPSDSAQYGKFEQAITTEVCNFDPSAAKIIFERVFKQFFGGQSDEKIVESLLPVLNAKLDAYDKILSKQKYLAGDNVTLADLFHLPYGHLMSVAKIDAMTTRPNVARWWKDITSRPAWKATLDAAA